MQKRTKMNNKSIKANESIQPEAKATNIPSPDYTEKEIAKLEEEMQLKREIEAELNKETDALVSTEKQSMQSKSVQSSARAERMPEPEMILSRKSIAEEMQQEFLVKTTGKLIISNTTNGEIIFGDLGYTAKDGRFDPLLLMPFETRDLEIDGFTIDELKKSKNFRGFLQKKWVKFGVLEEEHKVKFATISDKIQHDPSVAPVVINHPNPFIDRLKEQKETETLKGLSPEERERYKLLRDTRISR